MTNDLLLRLRRPMLASEAELDRLIFPYWASPKLDGIRCVVLDGKALYRSLKPIANRYIRRGIEIYGKLLSNYDGEIMVGKDETNFNEITSAVNSMEGEPNFHFIVFDYMGAMSYENRFIVRKRLRIHFLKYIHNQLVQNLDELFQFEEDCLETGHEGVMLRRADGKDRYKHGRSTFNESYLLKFTRFKDAEAVIVGFKEQQKNTNPQEKNELGYAKRRSCKAGKVPLNTLGALIVESKEFGIFKIGTGMNDDQRKFIWSNQISFLGKKAKYRYKTVGVKDKPRFPTFVEVRDMRDM